jgi:predicted nucleic-acid-binding protein
MITVDTSALVRFFTNDIPRDAAKTRELIESGSKLFIPDVVFPELEYVLLGKTYNADREKITWAFEFLTTKNNITISKEAKLAIGFYSQTKHDMADCIIAASAAKNDLFSFDKKLLALAKGKL